MIFLDFKTYSKQAIAICVQVEEFFAYIFDTDFEISLPQSRCTAK